MRCDYSLAYARRDTPVVPTQMRHALYGRDIPTITRMAPYISLHTRFPPHHFAPETHYEVLVLFYLFSYLKPLTNISYRNDMTRLVLCLFAVIAVATAYPALPKEDNGVIVTRLVRAAAPDPDPHHFRGHGYGGGYGHGHGHHGFDHGHYGGHGHGFDHGHGHYGHGGYGGHGYPGYGGYHGYPGGYGGGHSNAYSQSSAGAINTPFGSAAFSNAAAQAGGFGR